MAFPVLGSLIDPAQINGIAGPMQLPGMPQPNLPPPSMLQRLRGRLGQMGTAPFEVPEAMGLDPKQAAQAQNSARIQLALGLLGNVGTGRGFGQGLTHALGNANQHFQGQLGNLHAIARQTKMDERQTKRDQVADTRWDTEQKQAAAREAADAAYKNKTLEGQAADRQADAAWREEQARLQREGFASAERVADVRARRELTENQRWKTTDSLRKEYTTRAQKVQDSDSAAQNLIMLAADPNIAKNASAQIGMVFQFQRMLDPESVTRDSEFKIISGARGLQEELQALIPRLQNGQTLTPEQIKRMSEVAKALSGKNRDRVKALDDYYGEIATRRQIDPFDVTGRRAAPNPNVIDVGGALGSPQYQPGSVGGQNVRIVDY